MSALVSIDMICDACGRRLPTTRTKVAGDADGQHVVRTVGDLTARHLGKRVRFRYSSPEGMGPEDEGVLYAFDVQRQRKDDVYVLVHLDSYDNECFDLTPDTPCEVLP